MNNKNCKIIQDLLPNYIENLTNSETNIFIEEHLKDCNECKKILNNMKNNFNLNQKNKVKSEVKYLKKFNKKLKILEILLIISLIISLCFIVQKFMLFRDAYLKASEALYDVVSEGIYCDTFYATIEEINDSVVNGVKEIKVKGLNVNDRNHREEYYFEVYLDNIPDNFKIKWMNSEIDFNKLKVGQTIAVYNYGEVLEETKFLTSVRMIVVLDDNI